MSESIPMSFSYDNLIIHSEIINGEPYFLAKEICCILKFSNSRKAIKDHCFSKDVTKRYTLSKGGKQQMIWINEAGLYGLIFGSKIPAAERFKDWVTHEVLPAIRKTGKYEVKEKLPEPVTSEQIIKVCKFSHKTFHDRDSNVILPILVLEEKILFQMQPILKCLHINWQSPTVSRLDPEDIYKVPYGTGILKFVGIDNLFRIIYSSHVAWAHHVQDWILYFVLPRLPHTKPFNMHMEQISQQEKEHFQLEEDKSLKFKDQDLINRVDSQYERNFRIDLEHIAVKAEHDPLMAGVFAGVLFKAYLNDTSRLIRIDQQIQRVKEHLSEKQEEDFNRGFKSSSKTISFQDLEKDVFDEE